MVPKFGAVLRVLSGPERVTSAGAGGAATAAGEQLTFEIGILLRSDLPLAPHADRCHRAASLLRGSAIDANLVVADRHVLLAQSARARDRQHPAGHKAFGTGQV